MAVADPPYSLGGSMEETLPAEPHAPATVMENQSQSSVENPTLKDLSINSALSFNESATAANASIAGELVPPSAVNGVHSLNGHGSTIEDFDLSDPTPSAAEVVSDPAVQQPLSAVREEPAETHMPEAMKHFTPPPEPTNGVQQAAALQGDMSIDSTLDPSPTAEDRMDTSAPLDVPAHVEHADLPHHPAVPVVNDTLPEVPLEPPTTPAAQDHTIVGPQHPSEDHTMEDAPPSPTKVARTREDEDEDERPALKRLRAEDEFRIPDLPSTVSEQSDPAFKRATTDVATMPTEPNKATTSISSSPITKPQQKYLVKGIQNLRRTHAAAAFAQPVDPIALKIPTYVDIIKKPMDLRTMEEKLKSNFYESVDVYVADFNQIVENTVTFNGPEHLITKAAYTLKQTFDKQMSNLPSPDVVEPSPPEKKAKTATAAAQSKPPPRRESRSSLGNTKSPTTAALPQTFALGPQGVPLIRRDSVAIDGRPKREIHPPAPRDLPYSNQKPKKKKYQTELKFCQEVVNEMRRSKYQSIGWPFHNPVDPVALNIPTYHKIIKKPMDLSTIEKKLKEGQYENAKEFEADIRLMFANCYKFNPDSDGVHSMGKQYEDVFDIKWAEKKNWIEDHTPASGPQSPGSSDPDEDEDEEDEEEEEEENELSILQKQIAAMSKQVEMIQKKKSSPPAMPKKSSKSSKPAKAPTKKSSGSTAPAKTERKGSTKTKKAPGASPYVTYEQKQDISNRINSLPETRMATALSIIRDNMPNLKGVQEDEIELDIDELSNDVLYKLLTFVRKYAPRPTDSPEPRPNPRTTSSAPSRPKKNKPMSKVEQEAKIQEIKGKLSGFQNANSDTSPEPNTKHQAAEETSGDEEDSEESEED